MQSLPRYVCIDAKGTYRYNPPSESVKAGVVVRCTMPEYDMMVAHAAEHNEILDVWKKEQRHLLNLSTKSVMSSLIKSYVQSIGFNKLSKKSKADYVYYMKQWYKDRLGGVPFENARIGEIVTPMCQKVYDVHASHSVSFANHTLSVYKLLFNYAIRNGFTKFNPFNKVLKRSDKPRRIVWDRTHLSMFMDTAFSKFEWRSLGLIVCMAHEWGQRMGDMRLLKWSSYDLETGVLRLEQSKRRARVTIPTSKDLQDMLVQQHGEYGWQQFIAPTTRADGAGGLAPYTLDNLSRAGGVVMQAAGLPDELQLMDLRRTAITEMVEAGVPLSNIMALSGHATPGSLAPYIKNTLRSASMAQQMRGMV